MSSALNDEKSIFLAAIERVAPDQWPAFLDSACGEDANLRLKVERLLAAQVHMGSFHEVSESGRDAPYQEPIRESPGTVIGSYKLLEQIGEGGFAVVFMAEQATPVRRKVALKLLKAGMDTRQVVARFEAERQALAIMDHPHIAKIFDGGTTPAGRPYFVMELVKGMPITEFCDQNHCRPRQRLALFIDVCQAVQHAHQKGIIHLDLKPSNVLVTVHDTTPVVKVIDFGIAKALGQELTEKPLFTGFAHIIGTPLYMSPEQAGQSSLDIDTRSDVYSLGVLLYELLTGTTPVDKERFKQATHDEIRRIIREEEPTKPSTRLSTSGSLAILAANRGIDPSKLTKLVRGDLDWIALKALEKDRRRRYETASALAMDVQRYLADEPLSAGPPSVGYRARKFAKRNRVAVLTALMISVSVLVGAALAAWQAVVATRANSFALTALKEKDQALTLESEQRIRAQEQTKLAEAARVDAIASAADTRAFSKFLVEDVLSVARPKGEPSGLGIHVTVKEALDAAEVKVEQRFRGRPKAEAIARHDLGVTYRLIGELDKSEEQLRRAYQLRTETLEANDEETLDTANSLAALYFARGKFAQAERLFTQALEGFRRILGEEHETTLRCMNNLGVVYKHRDQYSEANSLLVKSLEICRRVLGEEHPDTLSCMNNLAVLYQETDRLDEAEQLLIAAYHVSRRVYGEQVSETLTIMTSLGSTYCSQGQTEKAEPLLVKALELRRRILGEGHHLTFQSMHNVASLRHKQGRFDEAEALHLQALEGLRHVLGDVHPQVLDSMNNLAELYHSQRDFAKAEPLLLRAIEISRAVYGEDSPQTVELLNNLAGMYHVQGDLAKAEPIFVTAVERLRRVRGENHVHTIVAMGNLGALYRAKRDLARAETQLLETLNISRRVLGEEDSDTLSFVNELRMVYEDQGKYSEAEALGREILEKTQKTSGRSSPAAASAMATLGLNLMKQKKFVDAERFMRECLEIRAETEPDHWRTFATKSALGDCLLGQNKYADAEPLLLTGYEGLKERESAIPAKLKGRLTEALERLVKLYDAWGQKAKALEWQQKMPTTSAKSAETD